MPNVHSTYLTSFVVGKYNKYSDSYKNIPLGYYVYSTEKNPLGLVVLSDKKSVPTAFVNTKDMMRVYEQLTGVDFPYNKYDQTIVADFNFGGMENITATTLNDKEIFLADAGFARELVIDLVSHELAHSWFGDLVTCKNWSELWLNEGFATYMEAAYREKIYGSQDYLRKIKKDARDFKVSDAVSKKNRRGLFFEAARPDDDLFNTGNAAITYSKGSAVIHTLRETVGAENFWTAINIYLNRHKFQNVETNDLRRAMEETSKMDLNWFFRNGFTARVIRNFRSNNLTIRRRQTLDLTVAQTQKSDDKVSSAFRLPMSVEIKTSTGTTSQNIEITKREETFSFKIDGKPSEIVLDKEEKIPLKTVKYSAD